MDEQSKHYMRKILAEVRDDGYSETYENMWLQDYKEIPVDIDTFICDPRFLGNATNNGEAVYPHWREVLREIFNAGNKYNEIVFTGATRIGKSSTGITATAYMLYKLMCLRDPQRFFGKKDVSKFSVLFFNLTEKLAKGVAFREFNDTLKVSPWFNEHGKFSRSERNFYYIPEGDKVIVDAGSDASHALGMQVFVGFVDECNFSKAGVKDVTKAKEHIRSLYTTVADRIKGTFRMGGEVWGKQFAISSKRSDSDFMEDYVRQQIEAGAGDNMYIDDKPQWEVLPKSMFHKETFYIAVGDRHHKGFVIPDNQSQPEAIEELKSQGFQIMEPPIDMKSEFVADFDIALRDLAGIAVPGALSFITQQVLADCIGSRQNPFFTDIVQIGVKDNYTLEEFFHEEVIDRSLLIAPMYIHLDLSLNTDKTGISCVAVTGRKDVKSGESTISMPTFSHIFTVSLEAPRGDKIPYDKITAFIVYLRGLGFDIRKITRDQFQSEYMAQLLEGKGFSVDKISLDRTPDGYQALRAVLVEERVDMLDVELLQHELIHLQRDSISGKVDHPVGGCFTGDTKIRLVDGRELTIDELIIEQEYKQNWVYTINEHTLDIEPKPIECVFQTKIVSDLVEVTLDDGSSFTCTPDHRIMLRSGDYEHAENLTPGTSLMPLYTKISDKGLPGYRMVYNPSTGRYKYEHRAFSDEGSIPKGFVVHHCNYNKLDNRPSNLSVMSKSKHVSIHNNSTHDYSKTSEGLKRWYSDIRGTDVEKQRNEACRKAAIESYKRRGMYLGDIKRNHIEAIESEFGVDWETLNYSERVSLGVKFSRRSDTTIQTRISKAVSDNHRLGKYDRAHKAISGRRWFTNGVDNLYLKSDEIVPDGFHPGRTISNETQEKIKETSRNWSPEYKKAYAEALKQDTSQRRWYTDGEVDKYLSIDAQIPEGFYPGRSKASVRKNHKVVSVRHLHSPSRVYDLTIQDNHNFALGAGVFAHNSKDAADSFAGAIWTAIKENPGVAIPVSTILNAMRAANGGGYTPSSSKAASQAARNRAGSMLSALNGGGSPKPTGGFGGFGGMTR